MGFLGFGMAIALSMSLDFAVPQEDEFRPGAGPVIRRDQTPYGGKSWHANFNLDSTNHGGPGELGALATLRVNTPNPPGLPGTPDVVQYTVLATVTDYDGTVWADHQMVGRTTERAGEGHWQQSFGGLYSLPPGKYQVLMEVVDPMRRMRDIDGNDEGIYVHIWASRWYDLK